MSVAGWLDAMRSDMPPAFRLVWQCLESHANSARFWEIRDGDIAAEIRLSERTVGRAIERLEADGIVRVVRRKRLPTRYHMLRTYGAKRPNSANEPDLFGSFADQSGELTRQNVDSTPISENELTRQNADSSAELTRQNVDSLSPTESNRKKEGAPPTPQGGATRRRHPLPDDWKPDPSAHATASENGLDPERVDTEAEAFRDAAAAAGWRCADWHARFRNWLREEARRDARRPGRSRGESGLSRHEQIRRDGGFGSFLVPDANGRLLQ